MTEAQAEEKLVSQSKLLVNTGDEQRLVETAVGKDRRGLAGWHKLQISHGFSRLEKWQGRGQGLQGKQGPVCVVGGGEVWFQSMQRGREGSQMELDI